MSRKERRGARPFGTPPPGGGVLPVGGAVLNDLFAGALAQHRAGAFAEAERRYRYILTLFPDHADSLHNLGVLALNRGDAASAADLIGKAIKRNDRAGEYHYNIALAWRALNRIDRVASHLERAVALRPDDSLAYLNLGNVRREQGRPADAIACYERVLAIDPKSVAARTNLANIMAERGRCDDAIALCQEALAIEPNFPEAHYSLGSALLALGRAGEAVPHLETAVTVKPNLAGGYEKLGAAYLSAGKPEIAVQATARALELNETAQSREFFARCASLVRFTSDDTNRFRKLMLRALAEGWARPRELDKACISLIRLNGAINDAVARAAAAWPARLGADALLGQSGLAALAQDELLVCLLQCDPIADADFEHLLVNIRSIMLSCATPADQTIDERSLGFFAALARQCFVNEYVYTLPPDEADRARQLQSKLAQAIAQDGPIPPLWPIAVAAYVPLHTTPDAKKLLGRAWPDCVGALLIQQIEQPLREREIAAALPALTVIEDEVSRAVRQQYEENPYPRWVASGPPVQPIILKDVPVRQTPDVLVAGCGTGLSAVEFARQMSTARILAVDLSLASLSYAKRMAGGFGLTNIEFAQADIMKLGSIGRSFDFIDASGVLHHLADPWAGWRILLSLLRPGGVMQVGLYSAVARRSVVAARKLIAERGFAPTADGIRRCREYIMAADDPLLRSVTQWGDFFTVGECRDLLFHVQEHRVTLPQIKSFLADNGAQFAGFIPEPSLLRRFTARFPERAALLDLDCWQARETEVPDLFAAMYQFWLRKTAPAATSLADKPA